MRLIDADALLDAMCLDCKSDATKPCPNLTGRCYEWELIREQPTVEQVETNIYDTEETHERCTVQILSNSITGAQSIGWKPEVTGEWKAELDRGYIDCSNCHDYVWYEDDKELILALNTYKFCPHCGARMLKDE